ncbi:hypothetical protein AGLY_008839 [Aphis glycines]|uniref:DUF7869 domain-containing protein n=1 Tax=Aphis glycines TaxID=307491 RepID=A0A6G0TJR1_APHGL|nr:hypothetical protein AGLY_008839 [Aphis glycines]
MSDISLNGSSIDDWFNDSDYNPNSPIEVSEFENISDYSDYENVNDQSIIDNDWLNVNTEYDENIRVIEDSNEEQSDSEVRKSKKKLRQVNKWRHNVSKNSKAQGLSHISIRGKHVRAPVTGPPCKCNKKCFTKIINSERDIIIDSFNNIASKEKQDTYLAGLIKVQAVNRHRPKNNSKPKNCSCYYKIRIGSTEKIMCKVAFCSFFGIGKSRVERIIKSIQNNVPSPVDKRGKQIKRGNQKKDQVIFQIEIHIDSFPSRIIHYSRHKNESVRYLSADLNISKMYELYMGDKNIKPNVTYDFYRNHFLTNFNLSFGYPRSDTCQKCDKLQNFITTAVDETSKKNFETEKKLHIMKADVFYADIKQKTLEAKIDTNKLEVLEFDYQQNLPLPHIPCGDVFYKRQLWVYNLCITSGRSGKSYFFLYDEATGRKGQNEVISFLYHYFSKIMDSQVETVFIFTDNCSAQNKNNALVQYLYTLAMGNIFGLKKIVHRYLEPGHSFLPCDRAFGLIEKKRRKLERVFLPEEYKNLITTTCKKFSVVPVHQDMILNYADHTKNFFKKNVTNRNKVKFSILSYRYMEYTDEGLYASISVNSTAKENFILQKINTQLSLPLPSQKLYNGPLAIKPAKLKDIKDLSSKYVPTLQSNDTIENSCSDTNED